MANNQKSYRQLKEELDDALLQLESNTDDIDQAIEQYKQAQEILAEIEKYLAKSKAKIDKIKPAK